MSFWKKNSYQIVRLFVIQLGIAIFGLVLSFAVSSAFRDRDDSAALLVVSIFSVLFYLFILYSVGWEIGGKDRLRLDSAREKLRGGMGIVLALLAQVPNFLLCTLMLIGGILAFAGSLTVGARFFTVGYLPASFLDSMYAGITRASLIATHLEQNVSRSYYLVAALLFLATTLPAILVTGFAYWMGLNEKRIIPSAKKPGAKDKD